MTEPVLAVEGLCKRFGALTVTDGVGFEVRPGEIHALIGPNGAGKTTLIQQLCGRLVPDAGTIRFLGGDITRLPAHARAQRGLARTFQITHLLPGFTVLQNVATAVQRRRGSSFRFFRPAGRDPDLNAAAQALLARTGLAARAATPAGALSHGEKRQLELAMALALEPKLLVLDEPMAGTGREETARLVELLKGLAGGLPMILVEHDMSAVFALADRISVLVYGRIIATGAPDEIRASPEVRAAYLGEEAA
ncbi:MULTISPECIES: ABC transporter ATP-binding protein [Inquilinus]|uniref:Branched-chain amino acid transport system ATP-binding protein n=1 Tax=Inquilinus ginsengisoli TaxID=363840 RepID=A0ABU1JS04_9PROT|nr:ABC transporter ATP-binding protein [Inquilinus ginsengisoli]MDR6291400.1 branched-chain amino acid transport system ATP-binding protein [Inquilinus ginsengisoli]